MKTMVEIFYNKNIRQLNTFRMDLTCKCFVEYSSVADILDVDFDTLPKPVMHIGAGSNLLFTDDFRGTLLHSRINFIESIGGASPDGIVKVSVGSGVIFDDFCKWCADNGLWGTENLSHIPGEVGASAVQNIGAYGVEVKDIIDTVFCYDVAEEAFVRFGVADCGYGYRDSRFKRKEEKGRFIVTHVVFSLKKNGEPQLSYGHVGEAVEEYAVRHSLTEITPRDIRNVIISIRKSKLPEPSETGSAGSFFKNPVLAPAEYEALREKLAGVPCYVLEDGSVKLPAAWLIEQCGWKGKRSGNAGVYDRQPLVIVNATGKACPEEILSLENKIIASVKSRYGIVLQPEVEHI